MSLNREEIDVLLRLMGRGVVNDWTFLPTRLRGTFDFLCEERMISKTYSLSGRGYAELMRVAPSAVLEFTSQLEERRRKLSLIDPALIDFVPMGA